MKVFKNFEDAFTAAAEQLGMTDSNGDLIKATGKPISQKEYVENKERELREKLGRFKTKKQQS